MRVERQTLYPVKTLIYKGLYIYILYIERVKIVIPKLKVVCIKSILHHI